MDSGIPPNFPASSITLFDLPEKIAITCNLDEMPIERIKIISDSLSAFLADKDTKVIFLPDDLNLMFFYPRDEVQHALHPNFNRGNILTACPKANSSDAGLAGGNPESGEEAEDDNE